MGLFDDRIFKVELAYGETTVVLDGGLNVMATGVKYVDPTQNECTIVIGNLKRETRDQLSTHLTPFDYSNARKHVKLYAGRVSTGLFLLYEGDILDCYPSQPPDILLTIKSKTAQFFKNDIKAQSYAIIAPLSQIANGVSTSMGLSLRFEATDKNIQNYSYTGSTIKQVEKLAEIGNIDAYIDDGKLCVKNKGVALKNSTHVLSAQSGMIGIPEPTEYGVRVRCLLEPSIILGGELELNSLSNVSLNGKYTNYRIGFQIASRDIPFYSIIEATRYPALYFTGTLPQP